MAEQTVIQEPKVEVVPVVEQPKPEVDLITRVSQVKVEPKVEVKPEEGKFNINELDSQIEVIQDPKLKQQFVEFKKSLLRGENQKYQEVATLRKQYEQKIAEVTSWTPDRLKQELAKPDFVQSANEVLKGQAPRLSDEQYSALSDGEKAELNQLKQKLSVLEQSNWQAVKTQQDAQLTNKYANYNPTVVDDVTQNLMAGKIQATREDLWKVVDYENAVKRAYELGKQDKVNLNIERVTGMTIDSSGNMPSPNTIERNKGETIQDFMARSYAEHSKKK